MLKDNSLFKNVDLLILSGVIPHINYSFEKILKSSKFFLKNDGKIIINHSFYGIDKLIDYKIKKINIKSNIFIFFLTLLKTLLSYILSEKIFKKYFVFSLENNFIKRFYQFREFYYVNPYKIFYNYKYYLNKINRCNYNVSKFFAYSFSILIENNKKSKLFNLKLPPKKKTVLFGNDWVTQLLLKKYKFLNSTININEAIKYENIIIAYDCYKKNSYSFDEIFKKILKQKEYILGKNIFIYQMFC